MGRMPPFLSTLESKLEAWNSPARAPSTRSLPGSCQPSLLGPHGSRGRGSGGRVRVDVAGGSPSMSLVTVLKCIPAGDPSSLQSFAGSENPGPRRAVCSAASAATREAMLNALARGDSGLRASIGARRPDRRRLRLRAPGPTEAGPALGPRGRGPAVPLTAAGPGPRGLWCHGPPLWAGGSRGALMG